MVGLGFVCKLTHGLNGRMLTCMKQKGANSYNKILSEI